MLSLSATSVTFYALSVSALFGTTRCATYESSCTNFLYQFRHYHHHQSLNHESYWGTTDDFATSFLHFPLFSTALWDLLNSRPVYSLMSSSLLFLFRSPEYLCPVIPTNDPCFVSRDDLVVVVGRTSVFELWLCPVAVLQCTLPVSCLFVQGSLSCSGCLKDCRV